MGEKKDSKINRKERIVKKIRTILFLGSINLLFLFSCDNHTPDYSQFKSIEQDLVSKRDSFVFEIQLPDTVKTYQANLIIRYTKKYPFKNLAFALMDSLKKGDNESIEGAVIFTSSLEIDRPSWTCYGFSSMPIDTISKMKNKKYLFKHAMTDAFLPGLKEIGIELRTIPEVYSK